MTFPNYGPLTVTVTSPAARIRTAKQLERIARLLRDGAEPKDGGIIIDEHDGLISVISNLRLEAPAS